MSGWVWIGRDLLAIGDFTNIGKRIVGKKSVLRNANIANLFQRMGYIEKMGTGIIRMQELMAKAHLQAIVFQFTSFVTAVFKREYKKIKAVQETSVKTSVKIIELLNKESNITIPENIIPTKAKY